MVPIFTQNGAGLKGVHPYERTSTRCCSKTLSGSPGAALRVMRAFIFSFLLLFAASPLFAQPASSPCTAHRWFAGDGWRKVGGEWVAEVAASPNLQPKGIVRCASSAETESQLEAFAGIYNSADFAIGSLPNLGGLPCFNQESELRDAIVAGPTQGEEIVWFNFDIRPLAGTYQFQIVTNESVGWALYYVDPVNAAPTQVTAGTSFPTYTGYPDYGNANPALNLSGNCNTLIYADCGLSGNGWSTITVPSFKKPTNYYLAMWMADPGVGEGKSTFPASMNLVYKSRYGCGGSTCTIENDGYTTECAENGETYTVCHNVVGSAGKWALVDNAAAGQEASFYSITLYDQNDVQIGVPITSTDLGTTPLNLILGIIPDGAVKAKICATYPYGTASNLALVPDGTYSTGNDYVQCADGLTLQSPSPVKPTVDASISAGTGVSGPTEGNTCYTLNIIQGNSVTLTSTASEGATVTWSFDPAQGDVTFVDNGDGTASFTINGIVPAPANIYTFTATATYENGCSSSDQVCLVVNSVLPLCAITGPADACEGTANLIYSFDGTYDDWDDDFDFTWSIINEVGADATIVGDATNVSSIEVSVTGNGTYTVQLTILSKGIIKIGPPPCTILTTINPTPDAPGVEGDDNCGAGEVSLSASGCEGGTLNWYDAAEGGNIVYTGSNYLVELTETTSFWVSCTSADGCEGPRTMVTGTIYDIPAAPGVDGDDNCGAGEVSLSASGCEGGTLNWYDAAEGGNIVFTGSNYVVELTETTSFWVSCTSADGCEGP
uniref:immunoglobulin domain-containing protein n=1 Tax=Flavihumibacter sp. TaxID=1913981 RepID=UPI002FC9AE0E